MSAEEEKQPEMSEETTKETVQEENIADEKQQETTENEIAEKEDANPTVADAQEELEQDNDSDEKPQETAQCEENIQEEQEATIGEAEKAEENIQEEAKENPDQQPLETTEEEKIADDQQEESKAEKNEIADEIASVLENIIANTESPETEETKQAEPESPTETEQEVTEERIASDVLDESVSKMEESPQRNQTELTEIVIQEGNLSDNVFETSVLHDPADIETALDKMLKKKILPAPEIRYEVINYARKKVADLMITEDYDAADEIDIAIDIMTASIETDACNAKASSQASNLQNRLENARQAESQITDKWDTAIASVKESSRQKLSDLEQYHNQEREDFLASWERPEAKLPFSKPSPELLQIRRQQRAMALLHDFKSAKQMKQKAEELEKKEAAEGAKRYESSLKIAYKQLLDRQQREVQCLVENAEKHLVSLEQAKQKELGTVENTRRSLEARIIKPTGRGRRADSTLPQLPKTRGTTSQSMSVTTSTCPITQRTRSRLTSFRKTTDLAKLDIKTADARRIVKVTPGRKQRPLTSLSMTI